MPSALGCLVAVACREAATPPAALDVLAVSPTALAAPSTLPGHGWAPGPARYDRAPPAALRDATCTGCHQELGRQWASSLHRRAFTNPYYQRALAEEDTPFCRKCHAPQAPLDASAADPRAEAGVGCVTCHVDDGVIVGLRSRRAAGPGDHDVEARAALSTTRACEGCHDFAFPDGRPSMQGTHSEHAASSLAQVTCQGCHMPEVDTPRGRVSAHGFAASSDPSLLRSALRIDRVEREGARLAFDLASGAAGHAFPTGDLHRSVEVSAVLIDANGAELGLRAASYLQRTFGMSGKERVELSDTRLPPPTASGPGRRTVELQLPRAPAAGERVRWSVAWLRMDPEVAKRLGLDVGQHRVVLHEGVL